jgi:hypothetical protein
VYRDSFSSGDEALVMRRFGKTPTTRWKDAQRLYSQAGLQAKFKLYPRAGHVVTQDMKADIEATFRAAIASER